MISIYVKIAYAITSADTFIHIITVIYTIFVESTFITECVDNIDDDNNVSSMIICNKRYNTSLVFTIVLTVIALLLSVCINLFLFNEKPIKIIINNIFCYNIGIFYHSNF